MMDQYGKRFAEMITVQVKVDDLVPPALRQQVLEQNKRIAEMVDTTGIRKALLGVDFRLPDSVVAQVSAYRDQAMAEATEEADAGGDMAVLGRIVEEREAIITCLRRIGTALEGFKFIPELSPMASLVIFLFCMMIVLAEVANELLSEREGDQD